MSIKGIVAAREYINRNRSEFSMPLTRREFIRLAGTLVVGAVLAACGQVPENIPSSSIPVGVPTLAPKPLDKPVASDSSKNPVVAAPAENKPGDFSYFRSEYRPNVEHAPVEIGLDPSLSGKKGYIFGTEAGTEGHLSRVDFNKEPALIPLDELKGAKFSHAAVAVMPNTLNREMKVQVGAMQGDTRYFFAIAKTTSGKEVAIPLSLLDEKTAAALSGNSKFDHVIPSRTTAPKVPVVSQHLQNYFKFDEAKGITTQVTKNTVLLPVATTGVDPVEIKPSDMVKIVSRTNDGKYITVINGKNYIIPRESVDFRPLNKTSIYQSLRSTLDSAVPGIARLFKSGPEYSAYKVQKDPNSVGVLARNPTTGQTIAVAAFKTNESVPGYIAVRTGDGSIHEYRASANTDIIGGSGMKTEWQVDTAMSAVKSMVTETGGPIEVVVYQGGEEFVTISGAQYINDATTRNQIMKGILARIPSAKIMLSNGVRLAGAASNLTDYLVAGVKVAVVDDRCVNCQSPATRLGMASDFLWRMPASQNGEFVYPKPDNSKFGQMATMAEISAGNLVTMPIGVVYDGQKYKLIALERAFWIKFEDQIENKFDSDPLPIDEGVDISTGTGKVQFNFNWNGHPTEIVFWVTPDGVLHFKRQVSSNIVAQK